MSRYYMFRTSSSTEDVAQIEWITTMASEFVPPPIWAQWTFCTSASLTLVIAVYCWSVMYRNFLARGQWVKLRSNPVDLILCIWFGEEFLLYLVVAVPTIISLADSSRPMAEIFGRQTCPILFTCLCCMANLSAFSEAMVATYRILMIKLDTWVRYRFGKWKLFLVVEGSSHLLNILLLAGLLRDNYPDTGFYNFCMGQSLHFREVLLEFEQAMGRVGAFSSMWLQVNTFTRFVATSFALGCYIAFFVEVYRHNNLVAVTVLSRDQLKKRNRKNAITLFGHFVLSICSLAREAIFIVVSNFLVNGEEFKYFMAILYLIIKPFTFLLQIVMSPPMRQIAVSDFLSIKRKVMQ